MALLIWPRIRDSKHPGEHLKMGVPAVGNPDLSEESELVLFQTPQPRETTAFLIASQFHKQGLGFVCQFQLDSSKSKPERHIP